MIGKRSPGDRFIPSQDWNTLADMANRGMLGNPGGERTINGSQSVIIKVRNDTGAALARRSIVGLGGSAIDYAAYPAQWKRDIAIIAEVPQVGTHDKKWAIIQDSIPDGGYGEAVLYGVSQCTVDVVDSSHGYASITDNETGFLTSGASGNAIILWKESGTGEKLALIQHVVPSASEPFCEFHQFIGRDFETYNAGGTDYDRWYNYLTATLGDVRDQYTNGTDAYGPEGGGTLFVKYFTGSPESAGIEYHNDELDPHANGNFEILQDGLYRIRFNCYAHAELSAITYADRETDTFSSSSPVHSHMVEVWEPVSAPKLSIQMWRKPSGGSIALYADNQSNNPIDFGYIFPVMRKQIGDSASNPAYQISLEEDVNLDAGDRIGFRAYGYHLGYNAGDSIVKNNTRIRLEYGSLAFTYLGSQRLLESV